MDQKIPFTTYDFWAYLSAGFLLLFAVDSVANTALLLRENWTAVQGVVAVSMAYAIGQLVAGLSSLVFEKGLVGEILGHPRDLLFAQAPTPTFIHILLSSYFEPLPKATQEAVKAKGEKQGVTTAGTALFWAAYAYARETSAVMTRLETFLNLYGFCRNIALVAFVDSAIWYWSYLQPNGPDKYLLWARLSAVVGIGMTMRYLKFLKHYTSEVFTAYAYCKTSESANGTTKA